MFVENNTFSYPAQSWRPPLEFHEDFGVRKGVDVDCLMMYSSVSVQY